jgi:hypothetical protein
MLFRETVPAWLARRWMNWWLDEAGATRDEWDEDLPSSFDRLIPPQDRLSGGTNKDGRRLPGNLIGSPLHAGCARRNGGTLPLDPLQVARGNFEPDGRHWEHVMHALEQRAWGLAELQAALRDCPDPNLSMNPPAMGYLVPGHLPVIPASEGELDYTVKFCEFMKYLRTPGNFTYDLWLALATQLHRFGPAGLEAFHEISKLDSRYDAYNTNRKWDQTDGMAPIRCDTLVGMGFTCPLLRGPQCNGARAPAYFIDNLDVEIL